MKPPKEDLLGPVPEADDLVRHAIRDEAATRIERLSLARMKIIDQLTEAEKRIPLAPSVMVKKYRQDIKLFRRRLDTIDNTIDQLSEFLK